MIYSLALALAHTHTQSTLNPNNQTWPIATMGLATFNKWPEPIRTVHRSAQRGIGGLAALSTRAHIENAMKQFYPFPLFETSFHVKKN